MSDPLVSIIMAVKDTAPYLEDCLESVLSQTYENWELIAVNDHSTDSSPDLLRAYAERDSRIRVFDSDRPLLIPTLKYGYARSVGSLINRMDSDDKMPENKLELLVRGWLKYGKGVIISGGTQHFREDGEIADGFRRYDRWLNQVAREGTHYQEIYRECVIPSHCWIIHREDFDRVEAFEPEVYPEDYDLSFRFYKHEMKIIGIPHVLHFWRDREDRISRTWECYKDNRYFDLKLKYFLEIDHDLQRPLVLWGAGRNGKDLAKLLQKSGLAFHWVCDNPGKIGKDIYGLILQPVSDIPSLDNPQILLAVTATGERSKIRKQLQTWKKNPVEDYWFFI